MSDYPYTDRQVRQYAAAFGLSSCEPIREDLRLLHNAGITVTFPDPRFYVEQDGPFWQVLDREGQVGAWLALFDNDDHPDAKGRAQAEADRLNREVDR